MKIEKAVLLIISALVIMLGSTTFAGPGCGGRGTHIVLTEDQMELLRSTKTERIESGASPEETRAAVRELLASFGIELSKACGLTKGGGHGGCHGSKGHRGGDGSSCDHVHGGFWSELTEEQRSTLKDAMGTLVEAGVSCDEIHSTIAELAAEWDVELLCPVKADSSASAKSSGVKESEQESSISSRSQPNPFHDETEIIYHLKKGAKVEVSVYDVTGRNVVKKYSLGEQKYGKHSITWDATDEDGNRVPTGAYFYRIKAGAQIQSDGLIFLK